MNRYPCEGCKYYVLLDNRRGRRVCYYIVMEGHRRPCRAGADCSVRQQSDGREQCFQKGFEL